MNIVQAVQKVQALNAKKPQQSLKWRIPNFKFTFMHITEVFISTQIENTSHAFTGFFNNETL